MKKVWNTVLVCQLSWSVPLCANVDPQTKHIKELEILISTTQLVMNTYVHSSFVFC